MNKIISGLTVLVLSLGLTGCVTDGAYNVAKKGYLAGEALVEANADKLSDETKAKLKTIDDYATRYDQGRTVVKEAVEGK